MPITKNDISIKTRQQIKFAGDASFISALWVVFILLIINIIAGTEPMVLLYGLIGLCAIAAPFVWMSLRLTCRSNKPSTTTGFLIALLIFNLLAVITLVPITGVIYCISALARRDSYVNWYNDGHTKDEPVSGNIFSMGSAIICIAAAIAAFLIGILAGVRLPDSPITESATYDSGYIDGVSNERSEGYNSGRSDGYSEGYNSGFSDGMYCADWIVRGGDVNNYSACEPLR